MSGKFHLNPETGEVGRCSAKTKCPFGGDSGSENHYNTSEAARADYEKRMNDNTVPSARKASNPRDLAKKLSESVPGSVVWLTGSAEPDAVVQLDKILIPKEERGKGHASRMMKEIIAEADKQGWSISLTPDGTFGASVSRLKKFYKSFGFVDNKGRNKDFRTKDTMIRPPRKNAVSGSLEQSNSLLAVACKVRQVDKLDAIALS